MQNVRGTTDAAPGATRFWEPQGYGLIRPPTNIREYLTVSAELP